MPTLPFVSIKTSSVALHAETFVTNCPLFKKPLFIQDSRTEWDGYRGRFEILEAKLKDNA